MSRDEAMAADNSHAAGSRCNVIQVAQQARQSSQRLAASSGESRRAALLAVAAQLRRRCGEIVAANQQDCRRAEQQRLSTPLLKRLRLEPAGVEKLCQAIEELAHRPDPLNQKLESRQLDQHLILHRRTVPIGVIGFIFESRPDALIQIVSLALKSANCAILKGGSEAQATNSRLVQIIGEAAAQVKEIPAHWLALLPDRQAVQELLQLEDYIDLVIPRGSNQFVQHIMRHSNIPVLGHADGICHLYIDREVDSQMAQRLAIDGKCQYVAVCNALETILLHRTIAPKLLPQLVGALQERGVETRGCEQCRSLMPKLAAATEEDWRTEYLNTVVALRIVQNLEAAIAHINHYGSHHTDAIVSSNRERANFFMQRVDSASVIHNASTRFADGYRYGLGAEVGIATGKLHARGPVGLAGLLSYKWYLYGSGEVVADYVGQAARPFLHRDLKDE